MGRANITRLWSGQKGWSYPSLCIVDIPPLDFDLWYKRVVSSRKNEGATRIVCTRLTEIVRSMEHFQRNIEDALLATKTTKVNKTALHNRLLPLLRFVIEQWTLLFMEFHRWAKIRNLDNDGRIAISKIAELESLILSEMDESKWMMPYGEY